MLEDVMVKSKEYSSNQQEVDDLKSIVLHTSEIIFKQAFEIVDFT